MVDRVPVKTNSRHDAGPLTGASKNLSLYFSKAAVLLSNSENVHKGTRCWQNVGVENIWLHFQALQETGHRVGVYFG